MPAGCKRGEAAGEGFGVSTRVERHRMVFSVDAGAVLLAEEEVVWLAAVEIARLGEKAKNGLELISFKIISAGA